MDIRKLTDAMLRCDTTACADALGFNKVDGRIREAQGAVDNVLLMRDNQTRLNGNRTLYPLRPPTTKLEDAVAIAEGYERLFRQVQRQRNILLAALHKCLTGALELESHCTEALDAMNREMPEQDNGEGGGDNPKGPPRGSAKPRSG